MLQAESQETGLRDADQRSLRRDLLLVALLAALILAAFLVLLPDRLSVNESNDYSTFYRPVAENLRAGNGLVDDSGRPATRYPPGYPIFLAAVFEIADLLGISPQAAETVVRMVLWSAAATVVFLLVLPHWGPRGAWVATLVWTSYPLALWMAKQPNSELLFTPLLTGTAVWFWRQTRTPRDSPIGLLVIGVLAGVTMLVRPAAIGLGVLLALGWLWIRRDGRSVRRRAAGAALILLGNVLAVAPWQLWLHREVGGLHLLGTGTTTAVLDGLTFGVDTKGYRAGIRIPPSTRELMAEIQTEAVGRLRAGESVTTAELLRMAAGQAAQRPVGAAGLLGLKAARSWYGTDSQRFEGAIVLIQVVFLLPAFAAIVICMRGSPERRRLAIVTTAVVLYFWAMSMLGLSIVRYMVPVYALMVVTLPALLPANRQRAVPGGGG